MNLSGIVRAVSGCYSPEDLAAFNNISGFSGSARAAIILSVKRSSGNTVAVVTKNSDEAEKLFFDMRALSGHEDAPLFLEIEDGTRRTPVIAAAANKPCLIVGALAAYKKNTFSRESLAKKVVRVRNGRSISLDELVGKLASLGFNRGYMVEEEGDMSVRGGIVDIYPPGASPCRIVFDGNEIESIREFDTVSQRSIKDIPSIDILPSKEDEESDMFGLFDEKTLVIVDEPAGFEPEVEELRRGKIIYLSAFPYKEKRTDIDCRAPGDFNGDVEGLLSHLKGLSGKVYVVSKQSARLKELALESGYYEGEFLHGELRGGFALGPAGPAVFTDKEIFGESVPYRRFSVHKEAAPAEKLSVDYQEGDYVVHKNYGIAQYKGIEKQTALGVTSDYLFLQYQGEDKLYVPVSQMHLISKYSSGGDHTPRLNRLGTNEWLLAKRKAKKSIKDITKELMQIYSLRQKGTKQPYPPDSQWQAEFEEAFPYEETPDQLTAAISVKRDMESYKPMDRLLCGDVGYGKTEVALRAAFKAAAAGRQVCMLVPTTILAEQHYKVFKERFGPFPFKVEMLSRFRSKEEQAEIVKEAASGSADVIIGTHRLLQKDMKFKDLGLLIIDEEQRFGVSHKESIKKFKHTVDVLTLSATPIPRTLYMSLSSIRDMSTINTPPPGRSQISTVIEPWSRETVTKAVYRELERGGQVYYVHNRVETISKVAEKLRKMIPGVPIAVAHGQMDEHMLERTMSDFIDGKAKILISTTIIESGLDIPNVNTIIIENPQYFGLSTLYQLRGRVGRSNAKAYSYLLYERPDSMTEKGVIRLSAIKSFTALGSGQKIAMKDLEIRGAGNVLGAQQSGHMSAIGFDLYCEILKEASAEIKGEPLAEQRPAVIDIKISAFIPDGYIDDKAERIAVYRRINLISGSKESEDLEKELVDRFGKIPAELRSLFRLVDIKVAATAKGISKIIQKGEAVVIEQGQKKLRVEVKPPYQNSIISIVKAAIAGF